MKQHINRLLLLLALLVSCSCSIDYDEAMVVEELSEDLPDIIIYDFVQVQVKDGKPEYRIMGGEAKMFEKKQEQSISSVLFQEFNNEGEIVTEGWADEVNYFTETEDAELRGNLDFYSKTEEGSISAEYLYWQKEGSILKSNPEESVTLREDSGSSISGTGFEADFDNKEIFFTGSAGGTWVEEEKEESEDESESQ